MSFLLITISFNSLAESKTSSLMSKKCDKEKIKSLAGDALIKISDPQDWGGIQGFIVTLDTAKLTFAQLGKKMLDAGCN